MALSQEVLTRVGQNRKKLEDGSLRYTGSASPGPAVLERIQVNRERIRNGSLRYSPVDKDYIDTFIADANNYLAKAQKKLDALNFNTAADPSFPDYAETLKGTELDLHSRAGAIQEYLDLNRNRMDSDTYTTLKNYVSKFSNISMSRQISEAVEIYSRCDSQEDYNTAAKQYGWEKKYAGKSYSELSGILGGMEDGEEKKWLKTFADGVDRQEKMNFDLNAGAKEVEGLRADSREFNDLIRWYAEYVHEHPKFNPYNIRPTGDPETDRKLERYFQLVDQYQTPGNLDGLIRTKNAYLTEAKRLQEAAGLAAVADPYSDSYDPDRLWID